MSDPLCYNITGAITFLLCCIIAVTHTLNVPLTLIHFIAHFFTWYAHSCTPTVYCSFLFIYHFSHTGQLVAHLTSCFGSFITTSLSVYRPLYSRLTLTRTCNHLHAYTYIASYSFPSSKSYLIMASHIAHVFGLEIEALIEIGLKMCLHAWRKKRLVFGA